MYMYTWRLKCVMDLKLVQAQISAGPSPGAGPSANTISLSDAFCEDRGCEPLLCKAMREAFGNPASQQGDGGSCCTSAASFSLPPSTKGRTYLIARLPLGSLNPSLVHVASRYSTRKIRYVAQHAQMTDEGVPKLPQTLCALNKNQHSAPRILTYIYIYVYTHTHIM